MDDARQLKVVGQTGALVGSLSKVMGESNYADDLFLPRMLYLSLIHI